MAVLEMAQKVIEGMIRPTHRWQSLPLKALKHSIAFSSGVSKVLQDPIEKSNGKSDCRLISHPVI